MAGALCVPWLDLSEGRHSRARRKSSEGPLPPRVCVCVRACTHSLHAHTCPSLSSPSISLLVLARSKAKRQSSSFAFVPILDPRLETHALVVCSLLLTVFRGNEALVGCRVATCIVRITCSIACFATSMRGDVVLLAARALLCGRH